MKPNGIKYRFVETPTLEVGAPVKLKHGWKGKVEGLRGDVVVVRLDTGLVVSVPVGDVKAD